MRRYSWSLRNFTMGPLLQMVALLAVVAATSALNYPCSYPSSTSKMDCTDQGLNLPPPGCWPRVEQLNLKNNAISNLPEHSLSGFSNIKFLRLENNSLTELDFGVIATLQNLLTLNAENNKIRTLIPPAAGTTIPDLLSIAFDNNRISILDPDFFLFLPNLYSLILDFNPLVVETGQPIVNHPVLEILHVNNGKGFEEVDSSLLSGLPNLKLLSLSQSQVYAIRGAFVNSDLLTTINLSYNAITQITSGTFSSAGVIKSLNLTGNPLKRLDTAAVNQAVAIGGTISIDETPLACDCGYEGLYWWASSKGVRLVTTCDGGRICSFTKRLTSPEKTNEVTKAAAPLF